MSSEKLESLQCFEFKKGIYVPNTHIIIAGVFDKLILSHL